ncbi:hypothetical protein FHG87_000991 [Trinorchestia longiramus]|nr:hypothetical protein FHG87_000991 [Trinorchestia longiramus]
MESNKNTEKASKAITKYCQECKATYSLQLFTIRGCNTEECRFCFSNHESAAIIEIQSRKIQELSRQLELSCQLEFNRQIELLAGRLATIEIKQKQNYEHELRLQSSETHLDQHLYGLITSHRILKLLLNVQTFIRTPTTFLTHRKTKYKRTH